MIKITRKTRVAVTKDYKYRGWEVTTFSINGVMEEVYLTKKGSETEQKKDEHIELKSITELGNLYLLLRQMEEQIGDEVDRK